MFMTFSYCELCNKTLEGHDCLPVVEAVCQDCGAHFHACPSCRKRGCPACGGSLKEFWKFNSAARPRKKEVANASQRER